MRNLATTMIPPRGVGQKDDRVLDFLAAPTAPVAAPPEDHTEVVVADQEDLEAADQEDPEAAVTDMEALEEGSQEGVILLLERLLMGITLLQSRPT